MFKQLFFVFARYQAKDGLILYCVKASEGFDPTQIFADNVYLHTIYFKGSQVDKVSPGELVELQCVRNEKGFVYGFL